MEQYIKNGMIDLYHYTRHLSDSEVVLDPKFFGKHGFTSKDKRTSSFGRLFFYLTPSVKEKFFRGNISQYKATVPASEVYDLKKDPRQLIKKIREQSNGALDFDLLFNLLLKLGYNGVYYKTANYEMVNWFEPITAEKVNDQ